MDGYTTVNIETGSSQQLVDITSQVRSAIGSSGVRDGICVVFSMHTTAGITVNENADLGTWQGIYLCEFDGPRRRTVAIKVCGL